MSQPAPNLPGVELQVPYALATYPNKLIVDRLDLRQPGRRDSHMTLILLAYFVGVGSERTE